MLIIFFKKENTYTESPQTDNEGHNGLVQAWTFIAYDADDGGNETCGAAHT